MPEDPKPVDDPKPNDDPKPDPKPDEPDHKAEAEKWKAMARKHEKQAKDNAEAVTKLKQLEDAKKSDEQKAAERLAELEKKQQESELRALRSDVAADKAIPKELRRFLTGTTVEELEEQADLLLEHLASRKKASEDGEEDEPTDGGRKPKGRPKEKLRSGATPSGGSEELDPRKLADAVPPGW